MTSLGGVRTVVVTDTVPEAMVPEPRESGAAGECDRAGYARRHGCRNRDCTAVGAWAGGRHRHGRGRLIDHLNKHRSRCH